MNKQITILGFAGSLRKGSYNKALLHAALELSTAEAKLEIFDKEKIDDKGRVTDEKTSKKIRELLESLIAWTKKIKAD